MSVHLCPHCDAICVKEMVALAPLGDPRDSEFERLYYICSKCDYFVLARIIDDEHDADLYVSDLINE